MFKQLFIIASLILPFIAQSQNAKVVTFKDVDNIIHQHNDTTYVLNFWATWCQPCVHELPGFYKLDSQYQGQKVKLILVSMDFVKDFDKKLIPFIQKNNIKSTVWLLNDPDYNSWIDKLDSSWSGSIPATLIYKRGMRLFQEKELSYEELKKSLDSILYMSVKE